MGGKEGRKRGEEGRGDVPETSVDEKKRKMPRRDREGGREGGRTNYSRSFFSIISGSSSGRQGGGEEEEG